MRIVAAGFGCDDDLASCLPGCHVAYGFAHLLQRVDRVDARGHRASLDDFGQLLEVTGALFGSEHDQPLAQERRQDQGHQLPTYASGTAAAFLAAHDDGCPGWCERAARPGQARVPGDVEDQVVAAGSVGKVLGRVVDDKVRAQGSYKLGLGDSAHASDVCPEGLSQLDGIAAEAARRANNQHSLPLPKTPCFG